MKNQMVMYLLDLRALLDGIDGRNVAHKEDYGRESGWVQWFSGYRDCPEATLHELQGE